MKNLNYINQFLGHRVVIHLGEKVREEIIGVLLTNPYKKEFDDDYAIATDNGALISFSTKDIKDISYLEDVSQIRISDNEPSEVVFEKMTTYIPEENNGGNDIVNHPSHYTEGQFEVIDVIKDKLTPEQFEGYCIGNVMKYIMRYQKKNGLEDLQKAQWYLSYIIENKKAEAEQCKKQ